MKMPKDATPIDVACPEEAELLEDLSVQTDFCHISEVPTQDCRESQGMTKGDSRIFSISAHRTLPHHLVVSTSNAESVEVGEDASVLSHLREPARSRRSSPFTSSTSSQRSRCNPDERDAFAHEDMGDTETMTLTRGDHALGKMQGASSSPTDQPLNPGPEVCGAINQSQNKHKSSRRLRGARHSKWKTKRPSPSHSLLRELMRCDCEHLKGSRDRTRKVTKQIPRVWAPLSNRFN